MSSREEFEAWYRKDIYPGEQFIRDRSDNYNMPAAQVAWRAWQASRQVLEIELPQPFPLGDGWGLGLDPEDTREAIEAAGVRVKP